MLRIIVLVGGTFLLLSCSKEPPVSPPSSAFVEKSGPWQTVSINGVPYRRVSAKSVATAQADLLITIPIRYETGADGSIRFSDTVQIAGRTYVADCGMGGVLDGSAGDDLTQGSDGSDSESELTEATLAQVSEIFSVSCALSGCHSGAWPAAGLSLEGDFATRIVGVASGQRPDFKLVNPGNPDSSYLLIKVRGNDEIVSQQMPPGGTLPAEQVETIRVWIASGAKE